MKRPVTELSNQTYDVAVIGGGIYGASVARDAVLRGLRVALVEQGDFGHATSGNMHKIIHGGLRYVQHMDIKRLRESVRERNTLMRIAPHLVRPMPFLLPTYGWGVRGRTAVYAALKINDLLSFDRNRQVDHDHRIPASRIISKAECLHLCPMLERGGLTGGAIFFDGHLHNPGRFILSTLESAASMGADVANYVRATGFLKTQGAITGIQAQDTLTGSSLDIRARLVVNCSGPWLNRIMGLTGGQLRDAAQATCKAMVLVTRQITEAAAVAVYSRSPFRDRHAVINKGARMFVIVPWRDTSLIGTFQAPHYDTSGNCHVMEEEIRGFLGEINAALPSLQLERRDVRFVNAGLLPAVQNGDGDDIQLQTRYQILDHAREDGLAGLVSVTGVKFTTARDVAEKTTDLILSKLGRAPVFSRTTETPLHGGTQTLDRDFAADELSRRPQEMPEPIFRHLLAHYGSAYREVLRYALDDPRLAAPVGAGTTVTGAEVLHAVRHEIPQKLADVVFRRTELGTAGHPGANSLHACARIMAGELGWDTQKTQKEVDDVESIFRTAGSMPS